MPSLSDLDFLGREYSIKPGSQSKVGSLFTLFAAASVIVYSAVIINQAVNADNEVITTVHMVPFAHAADDLAASFPPLPPLTCAAALGCYYSPISRIGKDVVEQCTISDKQKAHSSAQDSATGGDTHSLATASDASGKETKKQGQGQGGQGKGQGQGRGKVLNALEKKDRLLQSKVSSTLEALREEIRGSSSRMCHFVKCGEQVCIFIFVRVCLLPLLQ
jgi:hypothetical protein